MCEYEEQSSVTLQTVGKVQLDKVTCMYDNKKLNKDSIRSSTTQGSVYKYRQNLNGGKPWLDPWRHFSIRDLKGLSYYLQGFSPTERKNPQNSSSFLKSLQAFTKVSQGGWSIKMEHIKRGQNRQVCVNGRRNRHFFEGKFSNLG